MWHYGNLDDELIEGMECETCGYAHNHESNKQYLKMLASTNHTVLRLSHYENTSLSPRESTIFTGGIIHIANDTPPNMGAIVTGSYIKEKTGKARGGGTRSIGRLHCRRCYPESRGGYYCRPG